MALVDSLRATVARLEAANARLQAELDAARRAGKRPAAPFRQGPPQPDPKTPGRQFGDAHGRHGHRPAPPPDQIPERYDAQLSDAGPHCRGALADFAALFGIDLTRGPAPRSACVRPSGWPRPTRRSSRPRGRPSG